MEPVKPYKTKLDRGNAYWMARLAQAVYTKVSRKDPTPDKQKILKKLKADDPKFRTVMGYAKNSAQAALVEHTDYLCMTFRGTDEVADWLDNINAFSMPALFGDFHRGFYKSVDDVWDKMFKRYESLMAKKKRPLFFTGHSLGGAMATVAAAKFVHEDWPFTSAYTFGSPRVMTRATSRIFNAECKARVFRFQNNNDIVTRAPARLMGYSHIGTFTYISEDGELHNDPGFWFQFVDGVTGAFADIKEAGFDGVKDHNMSNYLKGVKDWNVQF